MPTDSIINKFIYFDTETGEKHKLGYIEDIELTAIETVDEQKINYFGSKAFSIEIKKNRVVVYYLYWLTGKKNLIPNNWLKHHGFPMNRRK